MTPESSIDSGPAAATTDNTPAFSFSSDTPNASFECKVDEGEFFVCASPYTSFGLADGPHRFRARATDSAANTDPTPASVDFAVDTTEPETTPPDTTEPDTTRPDTALTSEPCSSPNKVKLKAKRKAKTHTFRVRAVGQAGNADFSPERWQGKVKRNR